MPSEATNELPSEATNESPSEKSAAPQSASGGAGRILVIAIFLAALAWLWFRDPGLAPGPDAPGPDGGKGPKPLEKGPTASSELWFGIKASNGPLDPSSGKPIGVLITAVLPGTPAEASGLSPGDLIMDFASKPVPTPQALAEAMNRQGPGKPCKIKLRRADRIFGLDVTLEDGATPRLLRQLVIRGATALAEAQKDDGSWPHFHLTEQPSPAVTALATWALVESQSLLARSPEAANKTAAEALELAIKTALARLADWTQAGELDVSGWDIGHRSYGTACAILAFAKADSKAWAERIKQLSANLRGSQVSETNGYDEVDWRFGGFPYYESLQSDRLRTDVSTLAYVTQALQAAGTPSDDPVWRRAGLWLDEAQNYALIGSSEALRVQEAPWRDGGFAFSPRNSKAGSPDLNGLSIFRSYGSATADGLRALIAVDGSATHERAIAALQWLARNYNLSQNPGLETTGPTPWGEAIYFYYLHSLARALSSARVARILTSPEKTAAPDSPDTVHHWPAELARELAHRQLQNGTWKSKHALMGEDHPVVATSLALLALTSAAELFEADQVLTIRVAAATKPLPVDEIPISAPPQDPLTRGLLTFRKARCASCHKDGLADNAPSLVGVADRFLEKFKSDAAARAYMAQHIRNPKDYPGTRPWRGSAEMIPYDESMIPGPQLDDLVSFLMSKKGDAPVSKAALQGEAPPVDLDLGARVYRLHSCDSCHNPAEGHAPLLTNLRERYLQRFGSEAAARKALENHIREPKQFPSIASPRRAGAAMTPYTPAMLDDSALKDLSAFLMRRP